MENNPGKFSWAKLPKEAEDVLGEEFWHDFQQFFPKKGPSLDFFETESEGIIIMDLPGLQSINHIQIKQSGAHLIIIGTIPAFTSGHEKIIMKERFTGQFERRITPPFPFTKKEITAKYHSGILEIHIQKSVTEDEIEVQFDK